MPNNFTQLCLAATAGLALASSSVVAQAPSLPPPPRPVATITIPAPPPPVVRDRPGAPVPKKDLGFTITMNDYPAKPRKRGEGGLTGFDLTVDPEGKPTACVVTRRSESRELDAATCRLALERMRFDPAIDAEGAPTTGDYSGQIRWDPKRKPDTPLPGTITRTFIVELDGSVSDCRITAVTGAAKKQHRVGPEPCRLKEVDRGYEPADPAVPRKRRLVTEVETITVSEPPAALAATP